MSLEPGTKLGAFEITGLLGKGGMGEVYRARDTKLGREVAIKVLPRELADDAEGLERFKREAKLLASLDHQNVCAVYEIGRDVDTRFIVMQLVRGKTLADLIDGTKLSLEQALPIFTQVAQGLDAAHERGIVHRDLKPGNIMVGPDGQVKILDFGIAKGAAGASTSDGDSTTAFFKDREWDNTTEGQVMGTPSYMSPEQARGQTVDKRTDIWALGCCLFQALAGGRPFDGPTASDTLARILEREPEWGELPDGLPRDVDRLLRRCMEKDVKRRLSSAGDLALMLEDVLADLREDRVTHRHGVATVSSVATEGPALNSLVVLPFDNLMGDSGQEYFVDGMTDALSAELSKIKALKVISRGSAMRYKGTEKSLPEIARELSVDALVEGSIFRAGNEVRITAQLIDGRSDEHLWAENYTGTIANILKLQSEVTLAIARAIRVTVTPEEAERIEESRAVNEEAYDAYLAGVHELNRYSTEGYDLAIKHLERATRIDPNYANAYGALSTAYWVPATLGLVRPDEGFRKARVAMKKAMELEPDLPQAHLSAGYIAMVFEHNWAAAKNCFERSLELDPNFAEGHAALGSYYTALRDFDAAIRERELAIKLDPVSPARKHMLGHSLFMAGRYDDAIQTIAPVVKEAPDGIHYALDLARSYLHCGRESESISLYEQVVERTRRLPLAIVGLAQAHARVGNMEASQTLVQEVCSAYASTYCPPAVIAWVYLDQGNADEAMRWFDEALEVKDWYLLWAAWRPEDDPIRCDPRYGDLLERMNLPRAVIEDAVSMGKSSPTQAIKSSLFTPAPAKRRIVSAFLLVAAALVLLATGIVLGRYLPF